MKNLLKVLTGVCLGIVVLLAANTTAEAGEIQYVIKGNTVYATSTSNPFYYQQLPQGAVIPANATVYVEYGSSNVLPSAWGFMSYNYSGYGVASFKTLAASTVGYDSSSVSLNATWAPYWGWTPCGYVTPCEYNPYYDAYAWNAYYNYQYYQAANPCPVNTGWDLSAVVAAQALQPVTVSAAGVQYDMPLFMAAMQNY